MAEQHSQPTGDGASIQWNITPSSPTTHFDKVDENWASPNTSDYIHETANDQSEEHTYPADGPADMVTVHTIHVDCYINTTNVGSIPGLVVYIYLGTTYHTNRTYNCDTGGAWQKRRFTFTGLSLTKAQYNTVRIRFLNVPGQVGWPDAYLAPEE